MKPHQCSEATGCRCSQLADEPNEKCPVHGGGEWPPRCGECGHFLPYDVRQPLPFFVEMLREPQVLP